MDVDASQIVLFESEVHHERRYVHVEGVHPARIFHVVGQDGTKVYFELYGNPGSQHRVAFAMGLGSTIGGWEFQIRDFVEKGYALLCMENRGIGESESSRARLTTSLMADDLRRALKHLQWDDAVLVGVSMGGMTALELACQDPQLFRGVMLINTSARGFFTSNASAVFELCKIFTQKDNLARAQLAVDFHYGKRTYANPERVKELVAWHLKRNTEGPRCSVSAFLDQIKAVATHWVSDERLRALGACGLPVVCATSLEDRMIPADRGRALAEAGSPGIRFMEFPGCGHVLSVEQPAEVNAVIEDLLRRPHPRQRLASVPAPAADAPAR
eukprot:tig00000955_g5792.t1